MPFWHRRQAEEEHVLAASGRRKGDISEKRGSVSKHWPDTFPEDWGKAVVLSGGLTQTVMRLKSRSFVWMEARVRQLDDDYTLTDTRIR